MASTFDYLAETQPIRVCKKKKNRFHQWCLRLFPPKRQSTYNIEVTQVILRRKGGMPADVRRRKLLSSFSFASLYLLAILLAETLTTIFFPVAGIISHALLMTAIFIHAAFSRNIVRQHMLATLALAPLIRIVSLAMPLQNFVFPLWYLLVGAPLFLSASLVARFINFRPSDIGLRFSNWPMQILFGFTGIILGWIEYHILRPEPLADAITLDKIWMPALILLFFTGVLEEVIFRGLMQRTFFNALGQVPGLIFVSLIFAVLHLGYHSIPDMIYVFIVAVLFGSVVARSHTLLGVILAHGLTNISLFLVFPFLIH